jgi:hypothetical protein
MAEVVETVEEGEEMAVVVEAELADRRADTFKCVYVDV